MGKRGQRYGEERTEVWGREDRGMGKRGQRYGEERTEVGASEDRGIRHRSWANLKDGDSIIRLGTCVGPSVQCCSSLATKGCMQLCQHMRR